MNDEFCIEDIELTESQKKTCKTLALRILGDGISNIDNAIDLVEVAMKLGIKSEMDCFF